MILPIPIIKQVSLNVVCHTLRMTYKGILNRTCSLAASKPVYLSESQEGNHKLLILIKN